jgi:hypothetical protein
MTRSDWANQNFVNHPFRFSRPVKLVMLSVVIAIVICVFLKMI